MFGCDSTKICLKVHPFASICSIWGGFIDRTFIGISFAGDPAFVQTEERWVYTGEGRGSYSGCKASGVKGKVSLHQAASSYLCLFVVIGQILKLL